MPLWRQASLPGAPATRSPNAAVAAGAVLADSRVAEAGKGVAAAAPGRDPEAGEDKAGEWPAAAADPAAKARAAEAAANPRNAAGRVAVSNHPPRPAPFST